MRYIPAFHQDTHIFTHRITRTRHSSTISLRIHFCISEGWEMDVDWHQHYQIGSQGKRRPSVYLFIKSTLVSSSCLRLLLLRYLAFAMAKAQLERFLSSTEILCDCHNHKLLITQVYWTLSRCVTSEFGSESGPRFLLINFKEFKKRCSCDYMPEFRFEKP